MSDPHQVSYFFLWCCRPESLCFWGFFVSRGPPPSPPPCFTCVCPCGVTLEAIDGLGWLWHASLVGTGPLYTNHCHVDQHDVSDRLCLTTRSHAVVLYNTLPGVCIEKAVSMKTQEELYQEVRLTPRVPRVVFKSNSQYGQQHPRSQEARSSWNQSSDSKSYGETCSNIVDYRISGVPLSAVEQQDTTRENKVKNLIETFEKHQHKESFFQDLSQTQKIIMFSRESQD